MSAHIASNVVKKLSRLMPRSLKNSYRRMTRPAILKRLRYSGEALPRLSPVNISADVTEFSGSDVEIKQQIQQAQSKIFADLSPDHRVMIKINLNSAKPYPASTDPAFLCWLVDLLIERGVAKIVVADCSSVLDLPTKRVMNQTGIKALLENRASFIYFDQDEWLRVPIAGAFLKELIVPQSIYEVDRIIYLVNLKSHRFADFSMSMKHAVGLMHPYQRYGLHKQNLQEKAVEISLAVQPDLIIMDARRPFMTGGPNEGEVYPAQRVFIGNDLLSMDLAGYKMLYHIRCETNTLGSFTEDPFQMRQFSHARKMLGGK